MKKVNACRKIAFALGFTLGLLAPVGETLADPGSHGVVPPNGTAYGYKYSELGAQWWQFVVSIPGSTNPIADPDGSQCVLGQRGPVWFLAFSQVGDVRTCSIPEDTALFFPLFNVVSVATAVETVKQLRADIAPCVDAVTSMSVVVDGVLVPKLGAKYRIRSDVFAVALPDGNIFGIDGGIYSPAVDDGYYVMLKPLSVGAHTLRFGGESAGCAIFGGGPLSLDVTYNLTVVKTRDK